MGGYLANGSAAYIHINNVNGAITKTNDIKEAHLFTNKNEADNFMKNHSVKTKNFNFFESDSTKFQKDVKENDVLQKDSNNNPNTDQLLIGKKVKRKVYCDDVKRLLYENSNRCCAICGKPIKIEDGSIDHIMPLSMGGIDSVENLQFTCKECNQLKGSILPDNLNNKISSILIFQLNKKYSKNYLWKFVRFFLEYFVHKAANNSY